MAKKKTKDADIQEAETPKGAVADTQLTNLSKNELMDELYKRGRTPEDIMNQTNLTGPEIEALATLNEKNKGGNISKQMELFEKGGLKEEGGTVDEESGNDVPIGSTKEEVRDDIPAQLSEGEFVFPADVVRFIGLEKLMQMRQEAKQGLKKMEAMGQMGNADEATLPDDMPFDMDDLEMEDEEDSNVNFNQGGVVSMAEGGTTPTIENKDLNKTDSVVKPITQQRTTIQQKPLNVRQQNVPIRGMTTNIPKAADFLKKKPIDIKMPIDFRNVAPTNIGSRYTGQFTSKLGEVQQSAKDVQNEINAVVGYSDIADDGDDSTDTSSGGVQSGGIDYASVDRFALDDDLRDVFNEFSKSQLSMFGVVTSNPISLAVSGIGMQFGKDTKGMSVSGPIATAELGKAKATAFHQTALSIQKEYGLTREPNINNWSIEAKNALAQQAPVAFNFAQDIFNEKYGLPERSFSTPSEKSFIDSIKGKGASFMDAIMSLGKSKPEIETEKIDPIGQQNMKQSLLDLQKSISNLAKKSIEEKAKLDKDIDDVLSGDPLGDEDKTKQELQNLGFNNNAMADIEANGGSKGTGVNSNGTSYSINVNGTFTHENGTTVNFTDSKGKPGNPPTTTPVQAPPPPPPPPPPSSNDNNDSDSGLDSSSDSYSDDGMGGWT